MRKLIECGWGDMEKLQGGFCCEYHRESHRLMYFAGAMQTLSAMTGWDPDHPTRMAYVDRDGVASVMAELTAEYRKCEQEAPSPVGAVRH